MKFRKRPVVVDAFQAGGESPAWFVEAVRQGAAYYDSHGKLRIITLEGDMLVGPSDWIIRGVKGELYPCKPDIFEATYEPVMPKDNT